MRRAEVRENYLPQLLRTLLTSTVLSETFSPKSFLPLKQKKRSHSWGLGLKSRAGPHTVDWKVQGRGKGESRTLLQDKCKPSCNPIAAQWFGGRPLSGPIFRSWFSRSSNELIATHHCTWFLLAQKHKSPVQTKPLLQRSWSCKSDGEDSGGSWQCNYCAAWVQGRKCGHVLQQLSCTTY